MNAIKNKTKKILIILILLVISFGTIMLINSKLENKNQSTTNEFINEKELRHEIENIQNLSNLLKADRDIGIYCQDIYLKKSLEPKDCREYFWKKLRVKGDLIKEQEIKKIKELDCLKLSDYKVKKIFDFYGILSFGENYKSEGRIFSTNNIKWARKELKKMMGQCLIKQAQYLNKFTGDKYRYEREQILILLKTFETYDNSESQYISLSDIAKIKAIINNLNKQKKAKITKIHRKQNLDEVAFVDDFRTEEEKLKDIYKVVDDTDSNVKNNSVDSRENNKKNEPNEKNNIKKDILENDNINDNLVYGLELERLQYKNKIVGRWISDDDPRYLIQFNPDFTVSEYYDNNLSDEGTWNFLLMGDKYILVKEIDNLKSKYEVVNLDNITLSLVYLDRGNLLLFHKE